MKTSRRSVCGRGTRVLGTVVVVSLVMGLGSSVTASADRGQAQQTKIGKWQQAMETLRVPGKGCFSASYPSIKWRNAQCKAVPKRPYWPAVGPRPYTVGAGNDYTAYAAAGLISSAEGKFDSISPGAALLPNTYSLQLNTQPFTTPLCTSNGVGPPACQGWQQFLYGSTFNTVFMEYWLVYYNASCPGGWTNAGNDGPAYPNLNFCFMDSFHVKLNNTNTVPTAVQLPNVTLLGTAGAAGDTVVMTSPAGNASAVSVGSVLSLASDWKGAEFAIVGDGNGSKAMFSAGTKLFVRTIVHSGTKLAPTCVIESHTGETNNLNLVSTPTLTTQGSPTMLSEQDYNGPPPAKCAAADGWGDTHLKTFPRDNLLYDFQASGDFVLATTGPDFIVQTRQVSGAPTWPTAAVNQAVATRIGTSNVAVCLAPTRLEINSSTVNLADGTQQNLPGGGDVSRSGNVYLIRGQSGDSVRAEVNINNPSWINVVVGLGRWPTTVHGLLANAGNNVNAIQSRGGTVFTAPFAFNDFYHLYGDSWRVPAGQSLLSACGGDVVASGNPQAPLYASDLKPDVAKTAQAVCLGARVKAAPLLDACTVDVAVLGNAAAGVYSGMPAPVTWGKIINPVAPAPAVSCTKATLGGGGGNSTFSDCNDPTNTGGQGSVPNVSAGPVTWSGNTGTTTYTSTQTTTSGVNKCPKPYQELILTITVTGGTGEALKSIPRGNVGVSDLCYTTSPSSLILEPGTTFNI